MRKTLPGKLEIVITRYDGWWGKKIEVPTVGDIISQMIKARQYEEMRKQDALLHAEHQRQMIEMRQRENENLMRQMFRPSLTDEPPFHLKNPTGKTNFP